MNAITTGNHLRWYRITRRTEPSRSDLSRFHLWMQSPLHRRHSSIRKSTNEHAVVSSATLLRSFAITFVPLPSIRIPHSLARESGPRYLLLRERSSSVIDRNLSLTSLPPGAKIFPEAQTGARRSARAPHLPSVSLPLLQAQRDKNE